MLPARVVAEAGNPGPALGAPIAERAALGNHSPIRLRRRNAVFVGAAASLPPSISSTNSEAETRVGRQGRIADYLTRVDFVVSNELGYLPFAQVIATWRQRRR